MGELNEPMRILIVDDEAPVLDAYRRILSKPQDDPELEGELADMEAELFGAAPPDSEDPPAFDLTLCKQGDEAVQAVKTALEQGEPFAVGFLDVRMPPGPDGVQTGEWIRELDPNIQLVFVTAFSDYQPAEMTQRIRPPDQLFYVQKPLRPQELRQFAVALCSRWTAERTVDAHAEQLVVTNELLREEVEVRTQAEQNLQELVNLYAAVGDNVPCSLWVMDEHLRIVMTNELARQQFGHDGRRLEGCGLQEVLPESLLERGDLVTRLMRVKHEGGMDESIGLRAPLPDGGSQYYDVRMCRCDVPPDGLRVLLVIEDVTQRRLLEEQLHMAARQESLGRLAGGVAHDFNNLLGAISGYAELLQMDLADDPRLNNYAEQVLGAVGKGAALTRQLLTFGRRHPLEMKPLDVGDMVRNLADMLRRLLGETIELRLDLPEGIYPVNGDKALLEQVLVNMAVNARDAMGEGGILTIRARHVDPGADVISPVPHLPPTAYVTLSISDTGSGIDSSVLGRIFEPFFTTKGVGKGTGLGLAMAYGCIQQHNGHITATSQVGQGSEFTIYLPKTDAALEVLAPDQSVRPEVQSAAGTILLVEDEEAVRDMVCATLQRTGYDVLVAACPREALALGHDPNFRADLLLSDVVMPGMNGLDLYAELARQHPTLRAIFMSGYSDEIVKREQEAVQSIPFIQKPFTYRDLASKVRETMEREQEVA